MARSADIRVLGFTLVLPQRNFVPVSWPATRNRITLNVKTNGRIDALEVLPLEVEVDGVTATQVEVNFIGRDMDLGLHRFPLSADAPGHFQGQGQVGICTQTVMPWRARVILQTAEGKIGSWFDFDVIRS